MKEFIISTIAAAFFVWALYLWLFSSAKEGYEDADGFHAGKEPDKSHEPPPVLCQRCGQRINGYKPYAYGKYSVLCGACAYGVRNVR